MIRNRHPALLPCLGAILCGLAAGPARSDPRATGQIAPRLHFEPGGKSSFVARGTGYGLLLEPAGATLVLARGERPAALRLDFKGGDAAATVAGEHRLPGRSHYLHGRDRKAWVRNVPHYGRVRSRGVWPGIDVAFYGSEGEVEFDFLVAPGAETDRIRLGLGGASNLRADAAGALRVDTSAGPVTLRAPEAYQETALGRRRVEARYVLTGTGEAGFALGAYDPALPLVIDPILSYSTYLGGFTTGSQSGRAIALDAAGNAYVTGYTTAFDFPVSTDAFQATNHGDFFDAFVTKLAPDGSIVWSTYLGGSGSTGHPGADAAWDLHVDGTGQVTVSGGTSATDFPTTEGAYQDSLQGSQSFFVTRLTSDGSDLVWSTYVGRDTSWESYLGVDEAGCVCVAGISYSDSYPTTAGAFQTSLRGTADVVVTKLTADGTALAWSTYLGGSANDECCRGVAVDGSGNFYLVGWTDSADFPTTSGAFQPVHGGTGGSGAMNRDAFVAKFGSAGNLVYATFLGGSDQETANGIAVDDAGNTYLTGETRSTNFPVTLGVFQTKRAKGPSNVDAFVTKLSATGGSLVYSSYLGGEGTERGFGITVDGAGMAYVTGMTASSRFPMVSPVQSSLAGSFDGFVCQVAANGSALLFSSHLGGSDYEETYGIAVAGSRIHVTGRTHSADYPTTADAMQSSKAGAYETGFVSIIDLSQSPPPSGGGKGKGNK